MTGITEDRRYCEQLLRESGSSFALSFALLPRPRREALMAIYAFCRLVDDIVDLSTEAAVAEVKLAWWQQELVRVFDESGQEPPQHPVGRCLRADIARFPLDQACFMAIIEGVRSDLTWELCPHREQLMRYCYQVSCCVGLLSIAVFGYKDPQVEDYAVQLGYAMQLTNIIRDVRQDAQRGRVYLPADELVQGDVEPAGLAAMKTTSPELRGYLSRLGAEVERMFADAFAALPAAERRAQLAGIVMGQTYRRLLAEMKRDGYSVMEYRIALPPHRKLWVALSCLARAYAGLAIAGQSPRR